MACFSSSNHLCDAQQRVALFQSVINDKNSEEYHAAALTTCAPMQCVLGALLFFVVPKSKVPGFKRSLTPDTFSQAAVEMDNIPEGVGSEVFCIVFDAGSTGESCSSST